MASEKGASYAMTMEIGATDISEMSETYLGRFIDLFYMLVMLVLMFNNIKLFLLIISNSYDYHIS